MARPAPSPGVRSVPLDPARHFPSTAWLLHPRRCSGWDRQGDIHSLGRTLTEVSPRGGYSPQREKGRRPEAFAGVGSVAAYRKLVRHGKSCTLPVSSPALADNFRDFALGHGPSPRPKPRNPVVKIFKHDSSRADAPYILLPALTRQNRKSSRKRTVELTVHMRRRQANRLC